MTTVYRVATRKAVFDTVGRKVEGEIVVGLGEKTINILLSKKLISETTEPAPIKKSKKK